MPSVQLLREDSNLVEGVEVQGREPVYAHDTRQESTREVLGGGTSAGEDTMGNKYDRLHRRLLDSPFY